MQTEQATLSNVWKPKALKTAADAYVAYGMSLTINICLPALKFIWQHSLLFLYENKNVRNKVWRGKEKKRKGTGSWVTDGQNHPKENKTVLLSPLPF